MLPFAIVRIKSIGPGRKRALAAIKSSSGLDACLLEDAAFLRIQTGRHQPCHREHRDQTLWDRCIPAAQGRGDRQWCQNIRGGPDLFFTQCFPNQLFGTLNGGQCAGQKVHFQQTKLFTRRAIPLGDLLLVLHVPASGMMSSNGLVAITRPAAWTPTFRAKCSRFFAMSTTSRTSITSFIFR